MKLINRVFFGLMAVVFISVGMARISEAAVSLGWFSSTWVYYPGNWNLNWNYGVNAPVTTLTIDGVAMHLNPPWASSGNPGTSGLDPTRTHTISLTTSTDTVTTTYTFNVSAKGSESINPGGVSDAGKVGSTHYVSIWGVFPLSGGYSISNTCGLVTTPSFQGTGQINLQFPDSEIPAGGKTCGFAVPGGSVVNAFIP